MDSASGGNELRRHMAGVAPSSQQTKRSRQDGWDPSLARRSAEGLQRAPRAAAQKAKEDPVMAMLIAGSIGYGLGWLTVLSRSSKHEPLPDYARKRA